MSRGKLLEAFGARIEYTDEGAGEPVVLLHCTGSCASQWNALAGVLASSHRVLAVNLHGYGGTSPWDGRAAFRLRHEAALIEELLRVVGEPAHLVGHSYGGSVALAFARALPEHTRSIALFEPASFHLLRAGDEDDARGLREIAQVAETVWQSLVSGEHVMGASCFVDYWSGCGTWSRMPMAKKDAMVSHLPRIGLNFQATMNEPFTIDALRRVTVPRLLMQGDRSTLAARRVSLALARLWPDAHRVTVEGAGHMGPTSHPADVNRQVSEFLRRTRTCAH